MAGPPSVRVTPTATWPTPACPSCSRSRRTRSESSAPPFVGARTGATARASDPRRALRRSSASSSTPRASPPPSASRAATGARPPAARASRTTGASCSRRTASIAQRDPRGARDHARPPSGWSTTSTSSRSSSARSATTCRPASTASCPSSPSGHLAGLSARLRPRLGLRRAHRQPVRSRDAAPLRARLPARAAARRSASCGRWRSRCASCSSRTCGAWRSASCAGRAAAPGGRRAGRRLLGVGDDGRGADRRRRCARFERRAAADARSRCSSSSGCATRIRR